MIDGKLAALETDANNQMRIHLKVWRQAGPSAAGRLVDYTVEDVSPDMSFLEMLDVLNEGIDRAAARIRWRSTRIAARGSAGPAGSWSTACRTARTRARPCASCTCAGSATTIG